MSDTEAARLMPIYRDVKQLLSSISSGTGVYYAASQLTDLIEKGVLTDGSIDRVRVAISANDLLIHARSLAERAEAIKAKLDEVAAS